MGLGVNRSRSGASASPDLDETLVNQALLFQEGGGALLNPENPAFLGTFGHSRSAQWCSEKKAA